MEYTYYNFIPKSNQLIEMRFEDEANEVQELLLAQDTYCWVISFKT